MDELNCFDPEFPNCCLVKAARNEKGGSYPCTTENCKHCGWSKDEILRRKKIMSDPKAIHIKDGIKYFVFKQNNETQK